MHPELKFQEDLAKNNKYSKLNDVFSAIVRKRYLEKCPNLDKDKPIYNLSGQKIALSFERIVIGDYGAFVEFTPKQALLDRFICKEGQEFRKLEKYKNCKYYWLTTKDNSDIKIYEQKHVVSYADYIPGMFYVSVFEIKQ